MYKKLQQLFDWENEIISEEEKQWNLIFRNPTDRQIKYEADIKRITAYVMRIQTNELRKEIEQIMNDLLYIIIYKTWNEKRQKYSYYMRRTVYVSGEENLGPQEKTFTVIFNPNIDKNILVQGVYVLDGTKHQLPKKYTISTDENGVKHYPYFYINEIEKIYPEGVYYDEKNGNKN